MLERALADRRAGLDRAWNHAAGLALPIALFVLALFAARHGLARLHPDALAVVAFLPLLLAAVGISLAARFDRGRLLHCLVLVVVALAVLRGAGSVGDGAAPRLAWATLCLVAPLALAALAALPDPGVLPLWREPRLLLLVVPALVALAESVGGDGSLLATLAVPLWRPVEPSAMTALGQYATIGAAAALVWRYAAQPTVQRGALLGVLAALALALHRPNDAALVIALATAATLQLTFTVMQESWSVAYVDPLTELPGRRALEELFRRLPDRYAIAMIDVDHFKRFNDTHGHHVGDAVLRMVAAQLREVGGGGLPHRYGGEEFTVVFPGKDVREALPHLETLREQIDASRFALRRGDRRDVPPEGASAEDQVLGVTVSIGVAGAWASARPSAVVEAADEALYAAKRGGRNRVEPADQTPVRG